MQPTSSAGHDAALSRVAINTGDEWHLCDAREKVMSQVGL